MRRSKPARGQKRGIPLAAIILVLSALVLYLFAHSLLTPVADWEIVRLARYLRLRASRRPPPHHPHAKTTSLHTSPHTLPHIRGEHARPHHQNHWPTVEAYRHAHAAEITRRGQEEHASGVEARPDQRDHSQLPAQSDSHMPIPQNNLPSEVSFYREKDCGGEVAQVVVGPTDGTRLLHFHNINGVEEGRVQWGSGGVVQAGEYWSIRVSGPGELRLFHNAEGCIATASSTPGSTEGPSHAYGPAGGYYASLFHLDGCYTFFGPVGRYNSAPCMQLVPASPLLGGLQAPAAWGPRGPGPRAGSLQDPSQVRGALHAGLYSRVEPGDGVQYRVVFSAESSLYHAYQTQASLYSFMETQRPEGKGAWTRLLTASERDDMAGEYPTFAAPRHPLSRAYSPFNKPDIVSKWFASPSAPSESEVVVLTDPDNWILKDLQEAVREVTPGFALASVAWFVGSRRKVLELWQMFCHTRCEFTDLDMSAAPYFIHSLDMKQLAPLWKTYTTEILRHQAGPDGHAFNERFKELQITWCVEMYGYVFAAAELGIKHKVDYKMQIRDVDGFRSTYDNILMIHMGRIWFPNNSSATSDRWRHTEGAAWRHRGIQVWCKCNFTAYDVIPWPIPSGTDFMSFHTARMLHNAVEYLPPLPKGTRFRGLGAGHSYHSYSQSYP